MVDKVQDIDSFSMGNCPQCGMRVKRGQHHCNICGYCFGCDGRDV